MVFCFLESASCDETHCFVQIIRARKTKTNKQNPERNTPPINEGLAFHKAFPKSPKPDDTAGSRLPLLSLGAALLATLKSCWQMGTYSYC